MFLTYIRRSNGAEGARLMRPTPELDAYLESSRRPGPAATEVRR
jgi:hypothetical protein